MYKPFVQNRVSEIRDLVDPEFWGYCNTKENPADITSKGCKAPELVNNDLWWKGAQFLKESDEMWPGIVEFTSETEEKSREANETYYSYKQDTCCTTKERNNT